MKRFLIAAAVALVIVSVVLVSVLTVGLIISWAASRDTPSTKYCPGIGQFPTSQPCPPDERGIG